MAVTETVDEAQCFEHLERVELHEEGWDGLPDAVVILDDAMDCCGHVLHDEVHVLFFMSSLGQEVVLQLHNVHVRQVLVVEQLAILVSRVLVNFLDSHLLFLFTLNMKMRFIDYAK